MIYQTTTSGPITSFLPLEIWQFYDVLICLEKPEAVKESKSRPITEGYGVRLPTHITNYKNYPSRMIKLATVSTSAR